MNDDFFSGRKLSNAKTELAKNLEEVKRTSNATMQCAAIHFIWSIKRGRVTIKFRLPKNTKKSIQDLKKEEENKKTVDVKDQQESISPFRYVKGKLSVKLQREDYSWCLSIILRQGYTDEEYENFLNYLDVDYDRGYGTQFQFGHVWMSDGSWLERQEYDGSEWWRHVFRPDFEEIKQLYCSGYFSGLFI